MKDEWYIRSNDLERGPVDRSTLMSLLSSGEVKDDDMVSCDRVAWVHARDIAARAESNSAMNGSPPASGGMSQDAQAIADEAASVFEGMAGGRDQIVILGRRQSGKTVYTSVLYEALWRSLDGMTMAALSGIVHRDTMKVVTGLREGNWPPATLENIQMSFEVDYHGRKRIMTSMDYSGELFRRAFVEEDQESPEVRQLLGHLDNAGALILLIDPGMVYEHAADIDAAIDDDFGMVQAVKRIRGWAGCEDVPIVLALTKYDKNRALIHKEGKITDFVKKHWPRLAATAGRIPVIGVSAVQTVKDAEGRHLPWEKSKPVRLLEPLKYCLDEMNRRDEALAERARREQARREQEAKVAFEREVEQKQARANLLHNIFWAFIIVLLILLGAAAVGYILFYR